MGDPEDHAPALVDALAVRSRQVTGALSSLDEDGLRQPSLLPGWSRLTIACHLRYGARALARMVGDAMARRPTAYYPEGRERQRPSTLEPWTGESALDVVEDLRAGDEALVERLQRVDVAAWPIEVHEPPDNRDLGPVSLGMLAMSALTEREVHGTDLGLDAVGDWSATFVRRVLPARIDWLATRRTNHRPFDGSIRCRWVLVADDAGRAHRIELDADDDAETVFIRGRERDLLALLLGRPTTRPLVGSRPRAVDDFQRAFPGP